MPPAFVDAMPTDRCRAAGRQVDSGLEAIFIRGRLQRLQSYAGFDDRNMLDRRNEQDTIESSGRYDKFAWLGYCSAHEPRPSTMRNKRHLMNGAAPHDGCDFLRCSRKHDNACPRVFKRHSVIDGGGGIAVNEISLANDLEELRIEFRGQARHSTFPEVDCEGLTAAAWLSGGASCKRAILFGRPGCDVIHEARAQAVIGFEIEVSQANAHAVHLCGFVATFDDRRYEGRKAWLCPTRFVETFRMYERQTFERMFTFDGTVEMDAAFLAGMPLDKCGRIDNGEFVGVFQHLDAVCRCDRNDGEGRAFRLPALGAAAGVIVRDVALDAHLHGIALAIANKRAAGKGSIGCVKSCIDKGMYVYSRHSFLLLHCRCVIAPAIIVTP